MYKFHFILIVACGMLFSSCNKDSGHTSLLGAWQCEQFPEFSNPGKYQVNISRNNLIPNASNQYVINNFYNLGFEPESAVFFVEDSIGKLVITPIFINGIQIQGTGIVTSDFSRIDWKYTVTTDHTEKINATYY